MFSAIFKHGEDILVCGGDFRRVSCLKLENDKWTHFNTLNTPRSEPIGVTVRNDAYLFGGTDTGHTSEILKEGSTTWQVGPDIPYDGAKYGCGTMLSENELLLICGLMPGGGNHVLILNVDTNEWYSTSIELNMKRKAFRCMAFNKKIVITGGGEFLSSGIINYNLTEVIDFSDGELKLRKGGDLKESRFWHGMGVILVDNVPTLISFGGMNEYRMNLVTSVEIWNDIDETWEVSETLKVDEIPMRFGFTTLPSKRVCE